MRLAILLASLTFLTVGPQVAYAQCALRPGMPPNWCFKSQKRAVPPGNLNPYTTTPGYNMPSTPNGYSNNYGPAGTNYTPPDRNYGPSANSPGNNSYRGSPSDPSSDSSYYASRQFRYQCEIDSGSDYDGNVCAYLTNQRMYSGDGCSCQGLGGSIQ
jgi:hypothetical protein